MEKGYIQIYTGNGKGKTTASVGLMVRALAKGYHVYFGQFMKYNKTGEESLKDFYPELLVYEQFGTGREISAPEADTDGLAAREGYARAMEVLVSGQYDVVVFDEILVTLLVGYVTEDEILQLLAVKPEGTELILTGRGATQALIDAADLVTEMGEVKHYYERGVMARHGIEF